MAKMNDAPDPKGGAFKAGINSFCMSDWAITGGKFGKQLEVSFLIKLGDKEIVKKAWVPFLRELQGDANDSAKVIQYLTNMKSKFLQYIDVLAAYIGVEAAKARYDEVYAVMGAEDIIVDNVDWIKAFEERFVVQMFQLLPTDYTSKPINVVMSYDGEYLNIPKYGKDNGYNIQFGLAPKVARTLRMIESAPIPTTIVDPAVVPDTEVNPFASADATTFDVVDPTTGADLPF